MQRRFLVVTMRADCQGSHFEAAAAAPRSYCISRPSACSRSVSMTSSRSSPSILLQLLPTAHTAAPQALVAHAAQRWCGLQAGPAPAANDAVGADPTTIRPARLATQHYDAQSDALRSVPAGLMLCITRIGTGGPTICCFRTGDALSRSFQAAAVAVAHSNVSRLQS